MFQIKYDLFHMLIQQASVYGENRLANSNYAYLKNIANHSASSANLASGAGD